MIIKCSREDPFRALNIGPRAGFAEHGHTALVVGVRLNLRF